MSTTASPDVLSELTPRQQELLLQGLRRMRSAVAMECRVPSPESDAARQENYEEIDELESIISRHKLPQKG